ncbi:MAG: polyphosphate:AMP phosphotransferase [Gammaproteobacteria bacterium]|nr:polyphosphate:AMP phosphotransferase [Gammaproteobacteria bacterium]MDH3559664.1 polyphosphate:AMP phosphotransferase [Gammaproteobacteria bacterium]
MFEAIELGQTLSKADFKAQEQQLRAQLLKIQRDLIESRVATLIIVAGVEGAGKGEVVDRFNKWFDNRGMETHAFWDETQEELERPQYWRFWRRLPSRGSIAVMFGGWYWDPIHQRAAGNIDDAELDDAMQHIRELERMLTADGMLIIKLWFHLSPTAHEKRMKKRRGMTRHVPHVGNGLSPKEYTAFLIAAERSLRHTDTGGCPWHMIESDNRRFRDISAGRVIGKLMTERLTETHVVERLSEAHEPEVLSISDQQKTILDKVDLDAALSREDYHELLTRYQAQVNELSWKAYDAKRSTVMVFEGWDAAGKGGSIRRLTNAIDARLFRVISVAAPTDEELAHHYLWRFWRQFPRAGYMALYDRSWYGRVLVERVEKFAEQHAWMAAYREINDFEEQLSQHGTILMKFWLHISPDMQLQRFREREKTPWKKHKITEEDWRNRNKWDDYRRSVNDMVLHTSTGNCPWTLVSANDKYNARIEVLKTVCEQLKHALD